MSKVPFNFTCKVPFKFVSYDIPDVSAFKNTKVFILREILNNKIRELTREEKDWITEKTNTSSYYRGYGIPLAGWCFPFNDVLKKYVVKQYDSWEEYGACDKTALRKILIGQVQKIVEIT